LSFFVKAKVRPNVRLKDTSEEKACQEDKSRKAARRLETREFGSQGFPLEVHNDNFQKTENLAVGISRIYLILKVGGIFHRHGVKLVAAAGCRLS
jgi:hypothetical protein